MSEQYAGVFVDISLTKLDQIYTYRIPDEMKSDIGLGTQVVLPFGSRKVTGTVVELTDSTNVPPDKLRDIIAIEDNATGNMGGELVALAYYMRSHFGSTMTQALKCVFPSGKRAKPKVRKIVHLTCSHDILMDELAALQKRKKHSVGKERLLTALAQSPDIPWDELNTRLGVGAANIRDIEKKGLISIEEIRSYRDPLGKLKSGGVWSRHELTGQQRSIADDFISTYDEGKREVSLLYGVTGSGKTEVYMEMIDHVIGQGKQAILLIPEISLTYQTVMRLYQRFGDQVSILHSRMTPGERLDQFERAKNKEISIMVGPRSALFSPFSDLGIIVIDEEHENSYKSEQPPRYHARDVAIERARRCGAAVVLGSASPSVESFARAKSGEYKLYRLTQRPAFSEPDTKIITENASADTGDISKENVGLPETEIVDLREELRRGNRSMISDRLAGLMKETIDRGEQVMLFLNRRGMAGFVSCRSCGEVIKCSHCDVSMTLHRDGYLHCHYCGHRVIAPKICPKCGSKYIGTMKAGTEKVEEAVRKMFPEAGILRMDADTTSGKEGHRPIIEKFMNREADILIGTQMIVKGHDFSGVTLMGILLADMSLNVSDYRSGERTFSLLLQACGRAGRRDLPGRAVIQTYQPDHYAISTAASGDYDKFFEKEAAYRKLLSYPPYGHLLNIEITSASLDRAKQMGDYLIQSISIFSDKAAISGPFPAGIAKLRDIYRMLIMVKSFDYEVLVKVKDVASDSVRLDGSPTGSDVWFDFDP